ncbi:acetylcholinesterase-like [Oppia nitens]|uniref:acetylcholinesterase-like n=1 Tax=Oppia nitens TaxID=1686743 RepID=UPI0023D9AA08|nr:acetylcholinesterase-like [Oppia nitens]
MVEGKPLNVFGSTVYTFLGIPYAEPPVGNRRFARTEPIKRWKGVYKAFNFSDMCPHKVLPKSLVPMRYFTTKISEDCLTLNIWTPDIRPKSLRTVMIWVHGGAFNYNSANLYDTDGRVLTTYGDVVVVSINYRNGALGFLNAQTMDAPGNMGIHDQALALYWIRDNIQRFGGDPKKLVPFGQSAGAISIGILMASDLTKNLFSRAITASGGALLPGILTSKTVQNGERFAKLVGCAQNREFRTNPSKVIQCLRQLPLNQIIDAQTQIMDSSQVAFVPTPDGYYNDIQAPANLLNSTNLFSNIKELLAGVVPNEGSWLMHVTAPQVFRRHTYPLMRTLDETRNMFMWYLSEKIGIAPNIAQLIANSMITGPEADTPINNVNRLTKAMGDNSITCPTIFMADELVARNKTVYMYLFDHKSKATKFGDWQGVSHYEEVPFVFGYPLRRTKYFSKEDINVSKRLMKIWSHFAKNGRVLPQYDLPWPKYSSDETYMVLRANHSSTINSFHERTCEIFKASFKFTFVATFTRTASGADTTTRFTQTMTLIIVSETPDGWIHWWTTTA